MAKYDSGFHHCRLSFWCTLQSKIVGKWLRKMSPAPRWESGQQHCVYVRSISVLTFSCFTSKNVRTKSILTFSCLAIRTNSVLTFSILTFSVPTFSALTFSYLAIWTVRTKSVRYFSVLQLLLVGKNPFWHFPIFQLSSVRTKYGVME